jgi:predicted MPP superfamily phosphohydrolase
LATTASGWPARVARALRGISEISVQRYELPVLPPAASALRIAFASDFHAGPTTIPEVLAAACAALVARAPDVILLGGDYVTLDARNIDPLAEMLTSVTAPLGCYAVLGNHDVWVDYRYIERKLERAGIEMITNCNVRLAAPVDDVWVCGLDDHSSGTPDARAAFAHASGTRILLMHEPSGILDIGDERFDVALCGHTHGGQIALPGGYPIVVPQGRLSRKYSRGRYDLSSGGTLIVSRGVGCSTLPFRVCAPPEIVECTLMSVS